MKMAQLPPLITDRLYRSTAASPAADRFSQQVDLLEMNQILLM